MCVYERERERERGNFITIFKFKPFLTQKLTNVKNQHPHQKKTKLKREKGFGTFKLLYEKLIKLYINDRRLKCLKNSLRCLKIIEVVE